jgi:hypothetical protein
MSDHETAAELRRRADDLVRLAAAIEATPALELDRLAGPATWVGPRPDLLADELGRLQWRLHGAADELRWRAWSLRRRADALDAVRSSGVVW